MIESIRGIVETCAGDSAVLRLGQISIRLGVTGETVRMLRPGEPAELFAHLYIREDVLALYGFGSREERTLFEALMGVTGVGPRAALGFLSVFSPQALRDAIEREDIAGLIRVPGVGRKTAQRVVLELKGKLSRVGGVSTTGSLDSRASDLVTVLTGLGYSAAEAEDALRSTADVQGTGTDEDRIRAALRYFAGH